MGLSRGLRGRLERGHGRQQLTDLFDWDPDKARANLDKHNVSFEEGTTVFGDPLHRTDADPDHSDTEDRFITMGASAMGRLLLVSHGDGPGNVVRIIGVRELRPKERRAYEGRSGRDA